MHRQTDKILNELFASDRRVAALGFAEQDLHAFIDAELSGQNAQAKFPTIFAEIKRSERVRSLYTELKELLQAVGEGKFETPAHHRFNFAYLKTAANTVDVTSADTASVASAVMSAAKSLVPEGVPWRLNELGCLAIDFSTEFLDSLVPPTPQLMGVKSARSKAGKTLLDYTLDTAKADLSVQIVARELSSDPSFCTVTVKVDIPSRGGWPNLGEISVALTVGDNNVPQDDSPRNVARQNVTEQQTDAFGEVHFENVNVVDLPKLHFEIDSGPD